MAHKKPFMSLEEFAALLKRFGEFEMRISDKEELFTLIAKKLGEVRGFTYMSREKSKEIAVRISELDFLYRNGRRVQAEEGISFLCGYLDGWIKVHLDLASKL